MSKNFNSNTANKEDWLTPPYILKALGSFDLDPCAAPAELRPWDCAKENYDKTDDGLWKKWQGRVWCNPPYGRKTFSWICKLASHGNGVALIFARTETAGFHVEIWQRADAVFFFSGRLKFYHLSAREGGTANAPSCLVCYGKDNVKAVAESGLRGKLICLRSENEQVSPAQISCDQNRT